jgi:hypothetical protein
MAMAVEKTRVLAQATTTTAALCVTQMQRSDSFAEKGP